MQLKKAKNKMQGTLLSGIAHVDGRDHVFGTCKVDLSW
jgi:hypothetical protein